jgi:small-conductance mechanosensitive channel
LKLNGLDADLAAHRVREAERNLRGDLRLNADDLEGIRDLAAKSWIGHLFKAYFTHGVKRNVERDLRISMLHSNCEPHDTFAATAVASIIGILFGALHCIAWNFHFLSQPERTLWHVWSTIITTIPILLFTKSVLGYLFNASSVIYVTKTVAWVTVQLVPVYTVARFGLLVQALVALRNLQPAERAQVNWVNFLPHL